MRNRLAPVVQELLIGWDHDLMVYCHWEYDLRTSIQLADAVAPIKPLWLEDDILNPDVRNSGGFLEAKRIADMADTFGLPMAMHNTGSQLHTWANCQWLRPFVTISFVKRSPARVVGWTNCFCWTVLISRMDMSA